MIEPNLQAEHSVVLLERITLPNHPSCQVAIVTLNRPDRLNCFNTQVVHQLAAIFAQLADETHRQQQQPDLSNSKRLVAVIFTGKGSSFCAGADLSNPPNPVSSASDLACDMQHNPIHHMAKLEVPLIGAVKGYCITGGFELALACDFLIGDETTVFRDTHVKFGLAPCWGLSQKLPRLVGPGRAKWISLTASKVPAKRAYEWGLLTELVASSKESSLQRAMKLVEQIASMDGNMVQRYKRVMEEGLNMTLEQGLRRERELGLAHYVQAVGDGRTFEGAKEFITDERRPRSRL